MKRIPAIIFLFLLAGCERSWNVTPDGLRFKIAEHGRGPLITTGSTVKIHYRRWIKDSTVYSNFSKMPEYVQLIPGLIVPYSPDEVLLYNVHEGDSVVLIQRGDSLLKKGFISAFRKGTGPDDEWITGMRVEKVFPNDPVHTFRTDSLINADKAGEKKKLDAYYTIEGEKNVKQYLQKHGISSNPLLLEGSYTAAADTSKKLIWLQLFDLNDHLLFSKDSLLFVTGRSGLPQAIDSSLSHYSNGSHVRWYLPAMKAFGENSLAGVPAYSDLVFDIRIRNKLGSK